MSYSPIYRKKKYYEETYELPVCPECGKILKVAKSKEEWGTEYDLGCNNCGYEKTNLVK